MPALIFNIRHQRINRVDCFLPVRYSKNYLYAEFNFLTQDWEGVSKTAVFKSQKYSVPVVLGESDTCLVPHEVLEETKFSVSVFGGNLITVDSEEVKVFESGYRSDLVEPPTPDVYTQILTSLNGKADDLKYENNILYLMANKNTIASVKIVAGSGGGLDGREVELRNNGEYIQWRYSGEEDWTNLVSLADLKGEKGDDYVLTDEDIEEIASKVKVDVPENVLTYDEQSLSESQQMQSRKNLGLYYSETKFEMATQATLSNSTTITVEPTYLPEGQKCLVTVDTANGIFELEGTVVKYANATIGFSGWYIFNKPEAGVEQTESGIGVFQEDGGGLTFVIDANRYNLPCTVTLCKKESTAIVIPEEYIPDKPATSVTYDDSQTQLGATNVQDAIGKLSEQKVDNPSTGEVGQILEIETVDENGKPLTYKAVDKPQGGSGVTTAMSQSLWAIMQKTAFTEALTGEELTAFKTAWGIDVVLIPCTGITLNKSTLSFTDTTSQTLTATVEPSDTTDKIVWSSNNNSVATVTNGVVKPLSNGSATITATCGSKSATCSVTVDIEDEEQVTLSSISVTYTGGEVAVGTALTDLTGITVTAHYSDGSTTNVTGYTLSGEIVEGSNTITVSYSGKTTTFTVTGIAESDDGHVLTPVWRDDIQIGANGNEVSNTSFTASDFINVEGYNSITAKTTATAWSNYKCVGFDENKVFSKDIDSSYMGGTYDMERTANLDGVFYIKLAVTKNKKDTFTFIVT